jgi:hypothetical protein
VGTMLSRNLRDGPAPFLGATIAFTVCLAGYLLTLAPTVTLWDAGEFLAASKVLGVPHPPGTPVVVFLSHAWAQLFPFGEYAFRVNAMTAVFGALSGALVYLVVFEALRGKGRFAASAAMASTVVSAFVFTMWENANETEVYMLASALVMASAWVALLWRRHRGTAAGSRYLVLAVYLAALSVGVHLLALLVGPGLIAFLWHQIRRAPHADDSVRRSEAGQLGVLAALWVSLVAVGLGSAKLTAAAAVLTLLAVAFAWRRGAARFALMALGVCFVGVSTYAFIYIRAGLEPTINMGGASNWQALTALIGRAQYPPRLPWDNPLFLSGADNPGRSLSILWLQILNYLQYFDWQWSRGLAAAQAVLAWPRLPFTLLFLSLGLHGVTVLHRADRSTFWLLLGIFLVTGPGLVAYMNFKPGFALGFDQFPAYAQHEVRERDYFFIVSFQVWGAWAGIGIATTARRILRWLETRAIPRLLRYATAAPLCGLALLPLTLNHSVAARNRDPEAHLAIDFAYDLLQSVEPNGILFTAGDNDSYPLWYAQEVLGIRRDVIVVVTPLTNLKWYIRQLRDRPVRPFDPDQAPWFAQRPYEHVPPPPHTLSDAQIASLQPQTLPQPFRFHAGNLDRVLEPGTPLYIQDLVALRVFQESEGKRPIYVNASAGSGPWTMFNDSLVREGLALRLYVETPPPSGRLAPGVDGVPVDVERTDTLANHVYRYTHLFDSDTTKLEPNARAVVANFGTMFLSLGAGFEATGNRERALESLERAYHLTPSEQLRALIDEMRQAGRGTTGAGLVP